MQKVKVEVKALDSRVEQLPSYETSGSAGADIRCVEDAVLQPGQRMMLSTGIAVAIPEGYEIQCRPRSGLAAKHGITVVNAPGTVDSDYRGELKVILLNTSQSETFFIRKGDRIAQLVLAPVVQAEFVHVDELSETERGVGGFGSTGR